MNGAGTAAKVTTAVAPGVFVAAGMAIPLASAAIAVAAVLLVRAPVLKLKVGEISLTLLGMLGAFVTVVDHSMPPGTAFWIGIGFGGMGQGLVEAGKSSMAATLKDRLGKAMGVIFNTKGPTE
jgi:hypothetical protein